MGLIGPEPGAELCILGSKLCPAGAKLELLAVRYKLFYYEPDIQGVSVKPVKSAVYILLPTCSHMFCPLNREVDEEAATSSTRFSYSLSFTMLQ